MADFKVFKRLNFFRGFLTTEDDWNEGERYHVLKRQLHNLALHAPGVVPHLLGGFRVSQRGRGELNVEVAAGFAIDGQGRDLYLPEPVIKSINPSDFRLPQTLYVLASFVEEPTDFVAYKENLQFKGHKRITEGVRVEVTAREPDPSVEVELARIALDKGVKHVKDAMDPLAPRANEIDLRFVPIGGAAGSFLRPEHRASLHELLLGAQGVYAHMAHALKVPTAGDVLHALVTFEMLLVSQAIDFRNLFHLAGTLIGLQKAMIADVERNFPDLSAIKDFGTYKWNVESVRTDRRHDQDLLADLMTTQRNATEALRTMFAQDLRPRTAKAAEAPIDAVWDAIKVRSEPFGDTLAIGERNLRLVDTLDIFDETSEKRHHFLIAEERDRYRSRQRLKYPDGVVVEDVGVHFEGGHAQFEVGNVEPNRDVVLISRIDYVRGDYEAEVHINGRKAPILAVPGNDMKFRWRNWPYVIPAEMVTEPVLRIVITPVKQDRDVNLFTVWAFQPA